jgi:phenylalanyl-tRNA synthetase alpha chain
LQDLDKILSDIDQASFTSAEELELFRLKYLSKKGILTDLFSNLKEVAPELKKAYGQQVNAIKQAAEAKYGSLKDSFENSSKVTAALDLSLPASPSQLGSLHPITKVKKHLLSIFEAIGYQVAEGPEIEDDWHNFTALNFPENHPARDMQDTFFLANQNVDGGPFALRTHTSSVQVRIMETQQPPIRILAPGRVYRNEAISARAHCFFHQVEGLYIDKGVSFADLKQTLLHFAREMFGEKTKIRLRPSYFPFTEPSAEMDISCFFCNQEGCNICKHSGWVEILGCGMVDPEVLKNCNIDPNIYTGFAFGMGIERITMLKYQINDLRIFSENDIRFLKQFKSVQ